MNFFKSILLEEPEPDNSDGSEPNSPQNSSPKHQEVDTGNDESIANPISVDGVGGWSFGGLVKTLTTRSESVLETYRRDLKEFGSGLKKETDLFREVASRAVKELPASIEVGTSAIDGVLKSTAEIISHGKDALLAPSDHDHESDASETQSSRVYNRFQSQLVTIQTDMRTYCEVPEDLDDYSKWQLGFVLDEKKEEIEKLVGDALEGMYKRVVPNEVDHDTFWYRYFYRVHKLKQQEDMRAKLVRRSLSVDDEEELTWDVDDDDDDDEDVEEAKEKLERNVMENKELGNKDLPQIEKKESSNEESKTGSSGVVDEGKEKNANGVSADKGSVVETSSVNVSDEKVESVTKSNEKVVDNGESCKDSDVSVVSTQPSLQEEEDLGWDEIEDLGSNDEKKGSQGGSPNKSDAKKRLSAAEEDEDLSWDIEDDDEPLKA